MTNIAYGEISMAHLFAKQRFLCSEPPTSLQIGADIKTAGQTRHSRKHERHGPARTKPRKDNRHSAKDRLSRRKQALRELKRLRQINYKVAPFTPIRQKRHG